MPPTIRRDAHLRFISGGAHNASELRKFVDNQRIVQPDCAAGGGVAHCRFRIVTQTPRYLVRTIQFETLAEAALPHYRPRGHSVQASPESQSLLEPLSAGVLIL